MEFNNFDINQILTNYNLPLPGTTLYPPLDKIEGCKLLRYEIDDEGIFAVMQLSENTEIHWTLDAVKKCTV